jgi:hypothetical protein
VCVNINTGGCLGGQPVDLGVFGGPNTTPAVPLTGAHRKRHGKTHPRCDTATPPHGATADAFRAASCVCAREVQMQCACGVVLCSSVGVIAVGLGSGFRV